MFWLILSPSEMACRHSSSLPICRLRKATERMQWLILLLLMRLTYDFSWKRLPRLRSK